MDDQVETSPATYEELAHLENEFHEIDDQILRTQYELQKPLYHKRKELVTKIPNFWALVFEQAPPEIDQFIQVADSTILATSLDSIEVTRPELEKDSKNGNPRSLRITFNFKPNDYFEDTQLVKEFWWRRSKDNEWSGLVSEPVQIKWKPKKDLTNGLTDLAYKLFEARKKTGDMRNKGLPEYTKLKKEVETWNARNTSFFTYFAWVSDRRYITAEEAQEANEKYAQDKQKQANGEKVEEPEETAEDDASGEYDDDVEPVADGEGITLTISDEIWPNAIKYFTEAQEMSEMMSEEDFESMDEDEEDDDGPVDIRSLVRKDGDAPPAKRQKK